MILSTVVMSKKRKGPVILLQNQLRVAFLSKKKIEEIIIRVKYTILFLYLFGLLNKDF